MLVRVLPPQLHYGIGSSVDALHKLMQKLEIRACKRPELKLAPPDITSEKLDETWKNPTQNSTVNAVSTATTAPPATAVATSSADPALVNTNPHLPPPQQTVAAIAASDTKPKEENNDQQSCSRDNSYRSKKKDKKKPQRGQHQLQQRPRGRGNDNRYGACHTCGRSGHRRQECHYSGLSCHNCRRIGHLASVFRQPKKKKCQHSPAPVWPVPPFPGRLDSHSRCSPVSPKNEPWHLERRSVISWSATTTPTTPPPPQVPMYQPGHPATGPPSRLLASSNSSSNSSSSNSRKYEY